MPTWWRDGYNVGYGILPARAVGRWCYGWWPTLRLAGIKRECMDHDCMAEQMWAIREGLAEMPDFPNRKKL